jgi:hypothetical protein
MRINADAFDIGRSKDPPSISVTRDLGNLLIEKPALKGDRRYSNQSRRFL